MLSHPLPASQPAKRLTAPPFPSLRARLQRRQESGPKPRSSSEFPGRRLAANPRGAGSTRSVLSHPLPAPQPAKSLSAPLCSALRARLQRKLKRDHKPRTKSGILGSLPHYRLAGRKPGCQASLTQHSVTCCLCLHWPRVHMQFSPSIPGIWARPQSGWEDAASAPLSPTSESPPVMGP